MHGLSPTVSCDGQRHSPLRDQACPMSKNASSPPFAELPGSSGSSLGSEGAWDWVKPSPNPKKPFTVSVATGGLGGGGSDHASFIRAGVPGFSWRQSGTAVYGRTWHSQWDTYDAAIEDYQKHSSVVIAMGALIASEWFARRATARLHGN